MELIEIEEYFLPTDLKNYRECKICHESCTRSQAAKHLESHGFKILYSVFCDDCSTGDNNYEPIENCRVCGKKISTFKDYQVIKEEAKP